MTAVKVPNMKRLSQVSWFSSRSMRFASSWRCASSVASLGFVLASNDSSRLSMAVAMSSELGANA